MFQVSGHTMLMKVVYPVLLACCLVQATVYVSNGQDNRHNYKDGSSISFQSLSDAVASLRKPTPRFEQIRILPGYYMLSDKSGLLIQGLSLDISGSGTDNTILDCQGHCNALVIAEAEISIRGLTIKNCASNTTAGGISARRSNVVLEDAALENNIGTTAGGVYLEDSTAKITATRFITSYGSSQSPSLVVRKSKLTLVDVTFSTTVDHKSTSDLTCTNSHLDIGTANEDRSSLPRINSNDCTLGFISQAATKTGQNEKRSLEEVTAIAAVSCNNDGKCDSGEDCLSCPKDCGCAFDGYKVESGTGALPTTSTSPCTNGCSYSASLLPEFASYMNGTDVYGKAFAYFIVDDSGDYTFQLSSKYIAGEVLIDGKTIISSKLIQPTIKASANIIVQSGYIHNISINFYSNSNNDRYLSLSWKDSDNKSDVYKLFDKVFYSVNICGDHIDDDKLTCPQDTKGYGCETYACLADDVPPRYTTVKLQNNATVAANCNSTVSILSFITFADCTSTGAQLTQCTTTLTNSTKISVSCTKVNATVCTSNSPLTCGTGICVERFAEDCFVDCYDHITTPCPSIAPPVGHISPGLPVRDDTFGNLIRNQMLWHLPGIEHVTYGFDIIKGEGATSPLFYFGYCSDTPLQTVQDTYRGNVYTIPAEVYAQPAPRCSFSMESSTYSSSVQMAIEMTNNTVKNYNADVGGGFKLFGKNVGANGAIAYSQEKSVEQARELETKQTGSLLTTEVKCSTSKVQVNSYTFHPGFLKDLASVTDKSTMIDLMRKYGTYFYDNVVLGGKLKQVTILDHNFKSQRSRDELIESAQKSFSGTVSAPMFSASGSYDDSIDSSINSDQQSKFESSSQRTTVITYGGPPGAFGPALSNAPTNFGDWARSVDKLPVPIDYELRPISDIIPKSWRINYNSCSTSAVDVWNNVEPDYYDSFAAYEQKVKLNKYTLYWYWNSGYINSYVNGAGFSMIISNTTTTSIIPVKDNAKNDVVPILDQYGPLGSYTTLKFSTASGKATQSPIVFDFYSSTAIDPSASFVVYLNNPSRSHNVIKTSDPFCVFGTTQSPGYKDDFEADNTQKSTIYVHDWTNGLLYSADSLDDSYTYGGVVDDPSPSETINCGGSTQRKQYTIRNYNNTWKVRDRDPIGTHLFYFSVNGTESNTTMTFTFVGDYGTYTSAISLASISNSTKQLITSQQTIKPGIGPIQEIWLSVGNNRDKVTSKAAPAKFTISNLWVATHFCPNENNNMVLSCVSNAVVRRVFRTPADFSTDVDDFQRNPVEVSLRPLQEYILN